MFASRDEEKKLVNFWATGRGLMAMLSSRSDPYKRVILHLDLDCFYAQVETLRLKVSPEIPLAVQQWNNLIAGTKLKTLPVTNS